MLFIILYEENSCSNIIDWECRDRSGNAGVKVGMRQVDLGMPIWIGQIVECDL